MNDWLDDLRTAVAFLTRLPMPHPQGADTVAKVPNGAATIFPPKNEKRQSPFDRASNLIAESLVRLARCGVISHVVIQSSHLRFGKFESHAQSDFCDSIGQKWKKPSFRVTLLWSGRRTSQVDPLAAATAALIECYGRTRPVAHCHLRFCSQHIHLGLRAIRTRGRPARHPCGESLGDFFPERLQNLD
jgi:hypothetical protein